MLQGLAIRQAFLLLDWLLVILFLVMGSFVVMSLFGVGVVSEESTAQETPEGGQGVIPPENASGGLAEVKPRAEYDSIVSSGLFGPAGQMAQEGPVEPLPPAEDITETQLRLKLQGTSATSPKDVFASAIILNEETNVSKTYGVGQAVVPEVTIEEVYPRKVILLNKPKNQREVLRFEEDKGQGQTASNSGSSSSPPEPPSGGRISVSKTELMQEVFMNYADLAQQIQPEMYRDENGNIAGITAKNLETVPLAKKLDIHEGDVLQSVNSEPIDSEQKIIELVNKYRNASMVKVGILRNGKPVTVTYRLE